MEDQEQTDPPDPMAVSRVLTSDLELLQKVADFALEDTIALASVLEIQLSTDMAPRQAFYELLLPKVQSLMVTKGYVDGATEQIKTAAARYGNKTTEIQGHKGLLVGKKIPGFFEQSRRERREAEREGRRRG